MNFDETVIINNKLGDLDLIAIPIASALSDMQKKGILTFFRSIDASIIPSKEQIEELAALEEVTFIGYPSGLYDSYNKTSIIRKGITATPIWNDFKGSPTFLLDAGVFPGSSGSPVFIYNQGGYPTKNGIALGSRIFFVGVITETILRNGSTFLNLGVAINSLAMYSELQKFIAPYIEN